ncbi:serine carboxypeptidase [Colletotrichum navitas]|uniref:Carboxypeptidase n=1 Tax=Colletotrichum navitas TaxID=681940 RepID=A0AAD8PUM6_9PEZI|nr:serine carboxypeptidase [Colletotrichum navitas]KAK1584817.1 serine carboxypeptidase [Colletotrichum navitas]
MAILSTVPALLFALASWAPAVAAQSAADYFVHELPGAPKEPFIKMHAGHVEVTPDHNGNMFFWHFQNQHIANKQRTVIWLNGGPGCSSEDGALMEIGPYRVKDPDHLEYNNGSWNEFANLLFVDNPVGTGFSFVDTNSYLHELTEMADQFVQFLEKWFAMFPEYEHDDLYISGESYAGQHIPYIAKHILERNKKPGVKTPWQLKGLLMGNAWISPRDQYDAYLKYAYEKKLIEKGSPVALQLEQQWRICRTALAVTSTVDFPECELVLQKLLEQTAKVNAKGERECINMYDIRLRDTYPSCGMNWPPDLVNLTPYLRKSEVVNALHIKPQKNTGWTECNGAVGSAFRAPKSVPSRDYLPDLLKEVPIVLFSGAEDLICNYMGTEAMIGDMEWNGGKGFELTPGNWAPRRDWTVEGQPAGFWQEARNLTYILFYNSSHMVPFDYARRSRDMLDRFMKVDISSVGGTPTDSRLDGEQGPATSVGDIGKNGTSADAETQKKLDEAKWKAYYRSGEIVLVIVIIAASAWGWYVWRERRKRRGYSGIMGNTPPIAQRGTTRGLEGFRDRRTGRDVETGDFDESELDDLHVTTPTAEMDKDRYSVGGDSDDEPHDEKPSRSNGGRSGR